MSMDASEELLAADGSGWYKVMVAGVEYVFHKTQLAPPAAVMAENYAR